MAPTVKLPEVKPDTGPIYHIEVLRRRAHVPKSRSMNGCSLFISSCLVFLALGCDRVPEPQPEPRPASSKPATSAQPEPTALVKEDLKVGEGAREVKLGDAVRVNYVGKLFKNGKIFDSNKSKDSPFPFTVGEGVIEGWSQGVVGMKKGGKRKLTIPGPLAYGEAGSPPDIPPNATLVFEIDLLGWDNEDAAVVASAAPVASAVASAAASAAPTASASAGKPAAGPAASAKK
jgi:hypothetical protein